jgi:hypothetical protein
MKRSIIKGGAGHFKNEKGFLNKLEAMHFSEMPNFVVGLR